ncbi:MAG TPA: LUD domain-containing protein [Candidatus Sumerlaeota bacterium]|nr:LUD domain-containing protein [Candidatus Sumerlaeota bacterium]
MSSRERILGRLRAAQPPAAERAAPPREPDRSIYRDYPARAEDYVAVFAERFAALRGEFLRAAGLAEAAARVAGLLAELEASEACGAARGLAAADPLIAAVLAASPALAARFDPPERLGMANAEMLPCLAGLTRARALVARSGGIVLDSGRDGGRRLSVFPPLHIVLARAGDYVASLEEALARRAGDADWSSLTIVHGPSRTADIEKTLVLGAHGPKRLAVIHVED